jgi:hypothetical protein
VSKKKLKQTTQRQTTPSINVILPESISKDELKQLIIDAYFDIEEEKKKCAEELRKKEQDEWHKIIKYKDYNSKINTFLNRICVFFNILFIRKKHIKGVNITSELFRIPLLLVFWFIKWGLVIFAVLLIVGMFYNPFGNVLDCINASLYALLSLLFSRFFRFASIEISKVEDHGYIFGAFTCVAAFIAIIIATISIVLGVSS